MSLPQDPGPGGRLTAGALRGRPVGYALAVASVALALGVRLLVGGAFPAGFPFLTFFPAIIIISYLAGVGPGIFATILSLLSAWFVLIEPAYSFRLVDGTVMPLLFFLAVAGIDITLIAVMQDALDRLSEERRLTARLYDQQLSLFAELQHRVANNMAFISGLLRLQKRRIVAEPASAANAFDEAVQRIETMSRVHRRLYDPAAANRALGGHLQAMCDELIGLTGMAHVQVHVDVPDLQIALPQLLPLSLVVAETVTNSLKHGFAGQDHGRITIKPEPGAGGAVAFVIRDNGVGLPANFGLGNSNGLGMRIVDGLVRQIGGTIATANEGGTVTRIILPATPRDSEPDADFETGRDSPGAAVTRMA